MLLVLVVAVALLAAMPARAEFFFGGPYFYDFTPPRAGYAYPGAPYYMGYGPPYYEGYGPPYYPGYGPPYVNYYGGPARWGYGMGYPAYGY
jgi:hypothetical protein